MLINKNLFLFLIFLFYFLNVINADNTLFKECEENDIVIDVLVDLLGNHYNNGILI